MGPVAGVVEIHLAGRFQDLLPGALQGGVLHEPPGPKLEVALGKPPGPLRLRPHQPGRDLPDLLVLQQPPHQLRPWVIFLLLVVAGKEHLCLDADEGSGHLQELPGPVQVPGLDLRHGH
jgi:hypothetical protein